MLAGLLHLDRGFTDTLIGDADGIYHPAVFNDRLPLGLKGTMSEAELRAHLNGAIRNKAARGELRRGLPVGFVWGEADGEVLFHPDEAVVTAIDSVFHRFAERVSARRVWLWFRDQGLKFRLQMSAHAEVRGLTPAITLSNQVLSNPVYAGGYVYGKIRAETVLDAAGVRRKRIKPLPRDQWQVLIKEHHRPFFQKSRLDVCAERRPAPPVKRLSKGSAHLGDAPASYAKRLPVGRGAYVICQYSAIHTSSQDHAANT
jgi:hypothetical protein